MDSWCSIGCRDGLLNLTTSDTSVLWMTTVSLPGSSCVDGFSMPNPNVRKTIEAENWSGYPIWGVAKLGIFTLLNRLGIPPQLQRMKVDRFTFIFTIEILEQTNHLENLSCWVATGTNRKRACIHYYQFFRKTLPKTGQFSTHEVYKNFGGTNPIHPIRPLCHWRA